MLSFAHMLLSAMQSAISLKVAQTGLASIQNPVHTLVMQLYPLCNAQLLTQGIAHRYFLWHRCLGHSQVWPWLRFVVCYLLGAVFVVLCQLWQPSGHFLHISCCGWRELEAVASPLCQPVQEFHYLILGAAKDHPSVHSSAHPGQGQKDSQKPSRAFFLLSSILFPTALTCGKH
jgi:hypothetical protein